MWAEMWWWVKFECQVETAPILIHFGLSASVIRLGSQYIIGVEAGCGENEGGGAGGGAFGEKERAAKASCENIIMSCGSKC